MDEDPAAEAGPSRIGRVVCVSGAHVVAVATAPPQDTGPHAAFRKGGLVKMHLQDTTVFGIVTGLSIPVPGTSRGSDELHLAELELVGEVQTLPDGGRTFGRGISSYPSLGETVLTVDHDDLIEVFAPSSDTTIRIGANHHDPAQPAWLVADGLLGKHFAILGTTGSGKSCATALILDALRQRYANAHVVVLDPHDEYAHAFSDTAECLGLEQLQLPYWLLNGEELRSVVLGNEAGSPTAEAAATILNELIPAAKAAYRKGSRDDLTPTIDTPVPYRMSDVLRMVDEAMGRLDKPQSLAPYRWLGSRLGVLSSDARYAFMFGGIAVHDTMSRILARLLRIPAQGRPLSILDLSGVPSEIINAVVSVLCRLIFDFAVWSRGARPILLVCEEAHRYAPATHGLGFEPTKQALARIAKEGRKYGVSLGIVSQRPAELATTVLAQCGTVLAFRMTNLRDQEIVRGVVADGAYGLLDFLPSLGDAEAVIVGEGVSVPLRARFDRLPPERQPRSGSAGFSASWQQSCSGEAFVAEVVERWRRQQR